MLCSFQFRFCRSHWAALWVIVPQFYSSDFSGGLCVGDAFSAAVYNEHQAHEPGFVSNDFCFSQRQHKTKRPLPLLRPAPISQQQDATKSWRQGRWKFI